MVASSDRSVRGRRMQWLMSGEWMWMSGYEQEMR